MATPTGVVKNDLMSKLSLRVEDLGLSEELINDVREQTLPGVDVVSSKLSFAIESVEEYCRGWEIGIEFRKRLAIDIATVDIVDILKGASEGQKKTAERAWEILRDIRDGKFKGREVAGDEDEAKPGAVAYGGCKRVSY